MKSAAGRFVKLAAGALAALAMSWGLAACGSSSSASTSANSSNTKSSTTSTSPSSSNTSSSSATSSPSSSDSSSSSSAATTQGSCATTQLTAKIGQGGGGGAGSMYPTIVLTNTGSTCKMGGYPGISFAAAGKQIGAAAVRESGTSKLLTLQQGQSAYAQLQITQAGNFSSSSCSPTHADHVVVYPPNQKNPITVATNDYTGCANSATPIIHVKPLQLGTGQ
ncbi:DUF4232 domain-containing protein [Bifidobacterium aquikefiricola]|uniref:DUF4232 domain-containing protein n=1 Tax=Bifidobacterium aquikefiricola TaxID=3059038 RepID=A0AB39U6D5_9BIFI